LKAELAEHIRKPYDPHPDPAPAFGCLFLLGERVMPAIPGQHVVQ
jgi:hypothetical protein